MSTIHIDSAKLDNCIKQLKKAANNLDHEREVLKTMAGINVPSVLKSRHTQRFVDAVMKASADIGNISDNISERITILQNIKTQLAQVENANQKPTGRF